MIGTKRSVHLRQFLDTQVCQVFGMRLPRIRVGDCVLVERYQEYKRHLAWQYRSGLSHSGRRIAGPRSCWAIL